MHAAERDTPNNLHNISEDGHLNIEHMLEIQIDERSSAKHGCCLVVCLARLAQHHPARLDQRVTRAGDTGD